MRGDFGHTSLADVLRRLYVERENGVLHVSSSEGASDKRIHFKDGVPIYCAADAPSLSRDASRELFYPMFAERTGEFSFEQLDLPIDEELALEETLPETILAGTRGIDDREVLDGLVGGSDVVFTCVPTPALPVFSIKLTEGERALLEHARENEGISPTNTDVLVDASDLDVLRSLHALLALGLLERDAMPVVEAEVEVEAERQVETTAEVVPFPVKPDTDDFESLLEVYEAKREGAEKSPPIKKSRSNKMPAFLASVSDATGVGRWIKPLSLALLGTVVAAAAWFVAAPESGAAILDDLRSAFSTSQASR